MFTSGQHLWREGEEAGPGQGRGQPSASCRPSNASAKLAVSSGLNLACLICPVLGQGGQAFLARQERCGFEWGSSRWLRQALKDLITLRCLLTSLPVAGWQVLLWGAHWAHILAWVLRKAEPKPEAYVHDFIKKLNPREAEMGGGKRQERRDSQ